MNVEAQLAVRTVQQNYFHGVDSRNWALYGSVFDEESVFDFSESTTPPQPPLVGRDAIVGFVRETMAKVTATVHHGFLRELEFPGDDEARALWAMEDILWGGEPGALEVMLKGWGHYHVRYRRKGDIWRISHIRLTRTHVEVTDLFHRMIEAG